MSPTEVPTAMSNESRGFTDFTHRLGLSDLALRAMRVLSASSLMVAASVSTAIAQQAVAAAPAARPTSFFEQMAPLIFAFAVMYILLIRPNSKKQKDHQAFISQIKKGDEVLTTSGILGRIEGLTEQFVTLEIAPNVRIKVLRNQIAGSAQSAVTATSTAGAKA